MGSAGRGGGKGPQWGQGPQWSQDDHSRALLAAIVASSDDAIVSKSLEGIVTSWNASAERIFGYSAEEMIGRTILTIIPEDRHAEETAIIARIRAGTPVPHFDTVRRRKDGSLVPISLTVSPVKAPDGRVIGASKIARDISERRHLDQARLALMAEVNHRSKNLLATVQSIIRHTAVTGDASEFVRRITERLRALSANQDLLVARGWRGVAMDALVLAQLRRLADLPLERIAAAGAPLELLPAAAQALGLAVHELATNARAFGALSDAGGRVALEWGVETTDAGQELVVEWRESGGPPVGPRAADGFGMTILQRLTGYATGGEVSLSCPPSGLVWALRAPLERVVVPPDILAPPGEPAGGRPTHRS